LKNFRVIGSPLVTAAIYATVASVWIFYSDAILASFTSDVEVLSKFQTIKGLSFVILSAAMIYLLMVAGQQNLKKTTEKAIADEQRLRLLLDTAPFSIGIHQHGVLKFINTAGVSMLEVEAPEDIIGINIEEIVHPDFLESTRLRVEKMMRGEKVSKTVEIIFLTRKGNEVPVCLHVTPFEMDGEPAIQVIAEDISERIEREELLENAIREKSILISEIHHRVKNNMAIISALMQLQAFETDHQEVRSTLNESVNRVKSIALIHEQLYKSQNLNEVRFDQYIKPLADIVSDYFKGRGKVFFDYEIEETSLNINQAVSCALFLNEAISNVFKYRTGSGESLCVISAKQMGRNIHINVKDNCPWSAEFLSDKQRNRLGYQLMETTADQLHGTFTIEEKEGMLITLIFEKELSVKGSASNNIITL